MLRAAGLADLADANCALPPAPTRNPAGGDGDGRRRYRRRRSYLGVKVMKSLVPDYLNLPMPDAPREFWQYLFPMPYRPELIADAQAHNLDPNLVAGLIRRNPNSIPTRFHPPTPMD